MTSTCTHPYYRTRNLSLTEQIDCGVRYIAYAQRTNPQVLRLLREAHGRGVLIFDFVDSQLVDAAWDADTLRP